MRRLKTIDEIYEEVKDYGLVITTDAPLETALNSRISTPRIDNLAITPRHIAKRLGPMALGKPFLSDLELIAAVSKETGLGFRHVYSDILNFREIRTHTADVRAHIATRNSRIIYESYSALPTLEAAMSIFDPDDPRFAWYFQRKGGVAIVGIELFDDLDKHFIPADFTDISIFTDDEFEMDTIYEVGNDRQLAENVASMISKENADDVAIVLNSAGPIADAVRAALYKKEIPFINSLNVRDLTHVRDYISFLSLSMRYPTLRVSDVKELFSSFGGFFRKGRDGYLLSKQRKEDMLAKAEELQDAMSRAFYDSATFAEMRDVVSSERKVGQITLLLKELNMTEDVVTPERVSEVKFAVDNLQNLSHNEQIPESETKGVLLADCKNSAFVDRPIVFFLGMEQEWNVQVVGKKYLDAEDESERNAIRLQALIQQGQKRVYMVNTNKNGKPARPCLSFDIALGERCDSFRDLCARYVPGRWTSRTEEYIPEHGSVEVDNIREFDKQFSKSSFNAYASCPRRYMFNELLPTADRTFTEFGNLIHEFAEFYACYGDIVRERGVDEFVDLVSDRYAGLSTPMMEGLDRERIRRAMINVVRYLDRMCVRAPLDSHREVKNRFFEEFGLTDSSDACETDHRSVIHPIHGIFDLYWDGVITDYKTGKAKDAKDIASDMSLSTIATNPEFQPLIYLALTREAEDPKFIFKLFYAMDRDVESVDDGFDIMENVRTVEVSRGDLVSYLRGSKDAVRQLERKLSKEFKPKAAQLLQTVTVDCGDDPSAWPEDEGMIERVRAVLGPKATEKQAVTVLNYIAGLSRDGMAVLGNTVTVPLATLNLFTKHLDGMHRKMLTEISTVLPAVPQGKVECKSCPYLQVCTATVEIKQEEESDE